MLFQISWRSAPSCVQFPVSKSMTIRMGPIITALSMFQTPVATWTIPFQIVVREPPKVDHKAVATATIPFHRVVKNVDSVFQTAVAAVTAPCQIAERVVVNAVQAADAVVVIPVHRLLKKPVMPLQAV